MEKRRRMADQSVSDITLSSALNIPVLPSSFSNSGDVRRSRSRGRKWHRLGHLSHLAAQMGLPCHYHLSYEWNRMSL